MSPQTKSPPRLRTSIKRISPEMLPYVTHGEKGPTIVMLHWLGGSARTWTEVSQGLAAHGFRSIAIDLPGFGAATGNFHYTVQSMADEVLSTLDTLHLDDPLGWLLVGHSMGGKVAAVVARTFQNITPAVGYLRGLILVSPSPPGPEPMPGDKRSELLEALGQSTGDATKDRQRAETFIDDNTGKFPIPPAVHARTTDDILRMDRSAFRAWLQHGSYEDWSTRVGTLKLPALIFAGTEDAALGPDAQRTHTLPHFSAAQLMELPLASHLSPLERPAALVAHFADFATHIGLFPQPVPTPLSPAFQHLLDSNLTAPRTRAVMQSRIALDDAPVARTSITDDQRHTLQALTACVIPGAPFNLASRLEQTLTAEQGDGWRFDALPTDDLALRFGLTSLNTAAQRQHGVSFIALPADLQQALLQQAQTGKLGPGLLASLGFGEIPDLFNAKQMQLWFEDIRGHLTRLYVADPRTLDRIGFTGFADEQGFTQIQLNQSESFETPTQTPPTEPSA